MQAKVPAMVPVMGYRQWGPGSLPVLCPAIPRHDSEVPRLLFQDGEHNGVLKVRQNCNALTVEPSIGAEAERRRRCGLR
jgi:hypothetical protein